MITETFYCPIMTRSARMYENPEPAEYCENEVENDGDACNQHEPDDEDWTRE